MCDGMLTDKSVQYVKIVMYIQGNTWLEWQEDDKDGVMTE